MPTDFARSPKGTLGLEWEVALIDAKTGELANDAPAVLERLSKKWHQTGAHTHATAELLQNTVELVSSPHTRVSDAVADMRNIASDLLEVAHARDLRVIASGCHPFSTWRDQSITEAKRYQDFIDNTAWWGRNMLIWGVHTHLGVDRQKRVIPMMHALIAYQPHLIALSASSPFWQGDVTGYASNRTMIFQQLASAGLPFEIETWEEFEKVLTDLDEAGIISEPTEARWDVRPAPKWGTLEVRTCDGASTLDDLGAMAAVSQCLVEDFSQRLDRGDRLPRLQPWFIRENKWRAARFGLDANIISRNDGHQAPLRELLEGMCERLIPIAQQLKCEEELRYASRILSGAATSSERQLAVFQRHGGGDKALRQVAFSLADEFQNSVARK
jgi:carboxylate-amine ligase